MIPGAQQKYLILLVSVQVKVKLRFLWSFHKLDKALSSIHIFLLLSIFALFDKD